MPRTQVKAKRVIPKEAQGDINEITKMFDQMTGVSNADIEVVIPKYVKVRNLLCDYCKIYKILLDFDEFTNLFSEYASYFDQIRVFINDMQNILKHEHDEELKHKTEDEYKNISEITMNNMWKQLKNEPCVKAVLITTSRLKRFSQFLAPVSDLAGGVIDDGFIKREPGLDMILLSFSDLDVKHIWASEKATPTIKKFILNILGKTYTFGYQIYDLSTSPDIDIKKFSSLLIGSIQSLKHQIPRCDKAFDIIAESVKLLENNFKTYYRSSIEAQNPSIILENFIVDVSLKQKNNISVMNQFKMIIKHLQRNSAGNKDPRIKSLFSMLNKQFTVIDEKYNSNTTTSTATPMATESTSESAQKLNSEPNSAILPASQELAHVSRRETGAISEGELAQAINTDTINLPVNQTIDETTDMAELMSSFLATMANNKNNA